MAFKNNLAASMRTYPLAAWYLIGVSGGRDSIALLHGLFELGYRRLVVCHLNHGLRGKEAQRDAQFVQQSAETMGLPVEVGQKDVPTLAKSEKRSLEEAAREARYRFFADVAWKYRCRKLLLAHQADDQVETFFFNLLRGTGPAGLAAMATTSERIIDGCKLQIIRPLLSVWRTQIDTYVQTQDLRWCEDATNAVPAHATRNRLRTEIFPLLEKTMGREVKSALWRTADLLSAEEDWISDLLEAEGKLPADIPLAAMINQPIAKQRRLIRDWLLMANVPRVGYREVELVRSLLDKTRGPAKINLPDGWHARRRAGMLFLADPKII